VAEHEARTKRLEGELSALSSRLNEDYLTQLMNRRGLARAFQQEATRSDRGEGPMCVALLDIDNFKHLNDRLGHAVGDQALVHLSRVLRESIRPTDSIARWGGEEFVVVMPDAGLEVASSVAERLRRKVAGAAVVLNDATRELTVTVSVGVAVMSGPRDTVDDLLRRADEGLYAAKRKGRNRVEMVEDRAARAAAGGG